MKNKIRSWGRKLTNTFVRKGTNRRIVITNGSRGTERKATVFVGYTKDGELQVHVCILNRVIALTTGESGNVWQRILKVNLSEGSE